ncbi:MAG: glycosyltransferase family 2 protein [Rubrivivax sp.]|nr:glycosyltransferase family 2 protein [Rubrivivax sp.]
MNSPSAKLSITVLLAVKNEASNLPKCLAALHPAQRVLVIDSHSTDLTPDIATQWGAEVHQFSYAGGYPKKRQWALDQIPIHTDWVFFLDADEVVPQALWQEIEAAITGPKPEDGYMIVKGFHFLGRPMRYGGFSHAAVLLVRNGKGRFEHLFDDLADGLDMEIHERVIVDGSVGSLATPVIHEDFKGLEAYITRHNKYSTWEARLRHRFLTTGVYGQSTITPRLFGNGQERRRWMKAVIIRLPIEPWLWFLYHYILRMGFLEGHAGLIASRIRASYIQQTRAKIFELELGLQSRRAAQAERARV